MGVRAQRAAFDRPERLLRRRDLRRPDLRMDRRQIWQNTGAGRCQRHWFPGGSRDRPGRKFLGVRAVPILRRLRL